MGVGGYSALPWKPRPWPAACDVVVQAWRASSAPEPSAKRRSAFSSGLCDVFKRHLQRGLGSVCSVQRGLATLGCLIRGLGHARQFYSKYAIVNQMEYSMLFSPDSVEHINEININVFQRFLLTKRSLALLGGGGARL